LPAQPLPMAASARIRPRPTSPAKGAEIPLKIHLYTWMSVNALLLAIWLITTPFGYFWPIWVAMPWGAALAIHAGVTKAIVAAHHPPDR
ncbi:MAG: hypothetical protein QOI47_2667, partial [Actinomycetota bacterium]|nr:hypothetical protein [Actinomycetota bacterium]